MGKRVFNTEFAPIEEIDGVKMSLEQAGIAYYEIKNSRLWLGGGSLCVSNPGDYQRAREVIETFQMSWREQARSNPVKSRINWALTIPLALVFILFAVVTFKSLVI